MSKNIFNSYPHFFKGDKCNYTIGSSGALSYLEKGSPHYPHISVGHDDLKNNFGFHVTLSRGIHIFFKYLNHFPFCSPAKYDRVSIEELWDISHYANEFAAELKLYRSWTNILYLFRPQLIICSWTLQHHLFWLIIILCVLTLIIFCFWLFFILCSEYCTYFYSSYVPLLLLYVLLFTDCCCTYF